MGQSRRLLLSIYAASGAAALVYEVAWTRLLTLQLGHTVAAASTVLAAFMGGLALGAWLAGRYAPPTLRAYATLEIAVAVAALVLPLALRGAVPALTWAYADGGAPARFALVRVAISLVLLGVPAAAMGATFPIAAGWAALARLDGAKREMTDTAVDTSALYASNTCGAAAGAIAAGFWLIPALGLSGTTWVGVGLNALAAGAAWGLQSHDEAAAEIAKAAKPVNPKKPSRSPQPSRSPGVNPEPALAMTAVAISGFAALVYEVAWTRLLALVIGPTTYAFATMAAAFIGGLAIGSAAGTRLTRHLTRPAFWMGGMLVMSSLAVSVAAWYAATRMPLIVAAEVADPAVAFGNLLATQASAVFVLLLPMTFALGATFPLALAAAGAGSSAGRDAARVYSANTVGAIFGALAAGFALIPWLGLRSTFEWTAGAAAVAGAICLLVAPRREARPGGAAAKARHYGVGSYVTAAGIGIPALIAILMLPPWDRALLSSGAYKYAPYIASGDLDSGLRAGHLEYYKEGAAGTVSVRRLTGVRALAIDGKVDASNGGDMLTQRLLGLLPVALHGHARDICVIGLGSGVTVGSALALGTVQRADVIEISPEVVEASHFFDQENGGALANPAVRLIVGDGRSHLLLTPRRYDVIVSEPSNPWMSGVATLFTREFFEAARARLTPDGLLCQWAHTYDISPADLQSIVRTFALVFPQGTLWLVGESDLLLIGGPGANMDQRTAGLAAVLPAAARDVLASVGIDAAHAAFDLLSLYSGGPKELEQYGRNAVIQTDDRTALEYSAPRGIYGKTGNDNAAAIRQLARHQPPAVQAAFADATDGSWTSRGTMELKAEAYDLAFESFRAAATKNSRNADALTGLTAAAAGARKTAAALEWLNAAADREPSNPAVKVELAHLYAASGDLKSAVETAAEAFRLAPDNPRTGEQLASIVADAGDADRLAALATSMAERFPDRVEPRYYQADALFLHGRTEEALAAARQVVALAPGHARAQNLLGAACATLQRRECAKAAFEASLQANPRETSTYVNLGVFHLQAGDPKTAAEYFSEALAIDPQSAPARDGLAQARAAANPR